MYSIVDISDREMRLIEQMGTKYKFWFSINENGIEDYLFKQGRPGTGEDWAEKIACELAATIKLPHAHYDLSTYGEMQGVISRKVNIDQDSRLVSGNELIEKTYSNEGQGLTRAERVREHTIGRVMSYFRASVEIIGAPPPPEFEKTNRIQTALDVFIGYLMFDAWIANQDRHDENWGIIRMPNGNSFLSPTFDHGSSMGRNETDAKRSVMLTTRDKNQHIGSYIEKARSALFPGVGSGGGKPLLTIEAFSQASKQNTMAATEWRERLASVSSNTIHSIVNEVPGKIMTDISKEFTFNLLILNKSRIITSVNP